MNNTEHKDCFGTIFPERIQVGEHQGKVFSLRIDAPAGMMSARPQIETDVPQWDDCSECPEFESCYRLCMARIALQNAVSANY